MNALRFRIDAPPETWDVLVAELHALGTLGIEERDTDPSGAHLVAWFADGLSASRVEALADPARHIAVSAPRSVPDADWERRWREGLAPRRIGPLWVRPSWCTSLGTPEITIDPERAFGSGEHASTRLALRLVLEALRPGDSVLDVGTGSGVLALGALRLGASAALGLEIDPVATSNARANAERNGLPLRLVTGTPDALAPASRFDVVVANLLLASLLPWLPRLAAHARRGLVLSGYLETERERLEALAAHHGLSVQRGALEPQSGDSWCAALFVHGRDLQSSSRSFKVSSKV